MELRPDALIREWSQDKFRPVYYFFGEESAAKADALITLKKLFKADDFNFCEFSQDGSTDANAVVAEAMTLPVFASRRLVIVRNPKISADDKQIYTQYLQSPLLTTTLVLLSLDRRPDKRDVLAQQAAQTGALCIFSPLSEDEAVKRLIDESKRLGKNLSTEAADILVTEAGTDWGILEGELEKLVLFVSPETSINAADVLSCLGYRQSVDPWAFDRLIQQRDMKTCLSQLAKQFEDAKVEEVVFRSLAQIRNAYLKQLKAKKMLAAGHAPRDIETKLRIYYDHSFFQRVKLVSEERLRHDLRRCLEVESNLKSKVWLDPKIELEQLVVELCSPKVSVS